MITNILLTAQLLIILKCEYKNFLLINHILKWGNMFLAVIIESVDSICRDGADTPISLNKSNGSELPNADVLSLFRQTTCSASASIHYNTLKVRKIYSYSDSQKFVKTRIVHHLLLLLLLLLLLSNSVQTAYRETGVSNRSNSFTKIIYTGAYMILDAQNLHTFSQSRQTPGLQPYKC